MTSTKVSNENEAVFIHGTQIIASEGTAGLKTRLRGQATTVSGIAEGSGGLGYGACIEPDVE